MKRFFDGYKELFVSGRRCLNHADQFVAVVFVLPAVEGVLRADGELSPSDETVRVLAVRYRCVRSADAALVHDLMVAPAVSEERQDLGEGVRPGALHVVHAAFDELCRFFVLLGLSCGLYVKFALTHQHLYRVEDCSDGRVVVGHLGVRLDALYSAELGQELLIEDVT